jgi:hypothetical protein
MFHVERLRAEIKAAIRRGDMDYARFLIGILVLLPDREKAEQNS